MRILIDGKAYERWGRQEDSDVRFSKHVGPSEGRVLSAAEAKAAAERATRGQREQILLWSAAILLVVVVIVAIAGGGGLSALKILVLALVAALIVGINVLSIGARGMERRSRLGGGGGLPPAGASVTFDETAFTLDNAVIPWASLTAELLIVVIESGSEDTTNYHVERIEAADGDRTQLFDRFLYSNGDAVVRMAYLKLIRERLPDLKR